MNHAIAALTFCLIMVFTLSACETIQAKDKAYKLENTVKRYVSAVRWSRFELAEEFIRLRNAPPTPTDQEFLKNIRITDYEIGRGIVSEDETETVFPVKFSYYHTNSATVRTLNDRQVWWYADEEKVWLLDGNLPDFKGDFQRRR